MPIPKQDRKSGAMIFYPTAQETSIIENERAIKKRRAEIDKAGDDAIALVAELKSIREELLREKGDNADGKS